MTLRSPLAAMLWELWRVTRAEVAWKVAAGTGLALAAMAVCAALPPNDDPRLSLAARGAVAALVFLVAPNFLGWLSLAKLNGGRPGFPLTLHYTHPVRTAAMVAVPLAYLSLMAAAIYLVSALLLRVVSGYDFPLLSVAAWIAMLNVVLRAIYWTSRSMAMLSLGSAATFLAWVRLARQRLDFAFAYPPDLWASKFGFNAADAALLAVLCLVCFGITLLSVTRQRRGDRVAAPVPGTAGSGVWGRFIELFRIPCPTRGAVRAQLWFEMKCRGLPLLGIALSFAIVVPLLFMVAGPVDDLLFHQFGVTCAQVPGGKCFMLRGMSWFLVMMLPVILLFMGAGAFGIRHRQGRSGASPFDATQAFGTTRLALLQILTKSACVVSALLIVLTSIWLSLPLLGTETFQQVTSHGLADFRAGVAHGIAALGWARGMALAGVLLGCITGWVATLAVMGALFTRYARGANIAAALLLLLTIAFVALALSERNGLVSRELLDRVFTAAGWLLAAAVVGLTAWLMWTAVAQRLLTAGYLAGMLLGSTVFWLACSLLLGGFGTWLAGLSTLGVAALLLLPVLAGTLAPWSLSRLRHV